MSLLLINLLKSHMKQKLMAKRLPLLNLILPNIHTHKH